MESETLKADGFSRDKRDLSLHRSPVVRPSSIAAGFARTGVSMMFIAIIGTRLSGKSSVEEYLISQKGFTCVRLGTVRSFNTSTAYL